MPIPQTHQTPYVTLAQINAFLTTYTRAYEKGNAKLFFSFFAESALENGNPVKTLKPAYHKIWRKMRHTDYDISVTDTHQVVGERRVCLNGQVDLRWEALNGRQGEKRGHIFMELEPDEQGGLRITRLDYRFD